MLDGRASNGYAGAESPGPKEAGRDFGRSHADHGRGGEEG